MSTTKERTLQIVLSEEDFALFKKAEHAYELGQSKLGSEIIHAWLFANKLILRGKK